MANCGILVQMAEPSKVKLTLFMPNEAWVSRAKRAAQNRGVSLSVLVEQLLEPVIADEERKLLASLQESVKPATQ